MAVILGFRVDVDDVIDGLKKIGATTDKAAKSTDVLAKEMKDLASQAAVAAQEYKALTAGMDRVTKDAVRGLSSRIPGFEKQVQEARALERQLASVRLALTRVRQEMTAGGTSSNRYRNELESASRTVNLLHGRIYRLARGGSIGELGDAIGQTAQSFSILNRELNRSFANPVLVRIREFINHVQQARLRFLDFVRGTNGAAQSMTRVGSTATRTARQFNQLSGSVRVISGVFVNLDRSLRGFASRMTLTTSRFFSGFRQIGQAFLNLGITASLFVGLPLHRLGSDMLDIMQSFDEALNSVGKTTGLTRTQLTELGNGVRSMALGIPIAVNELAQLGIVAGQLGIKSVPQIQKLIEVGGKLSIATDLTAEESVTALGRLATAFETQLHAAGISVEDFVGRMGNVLVRLGNDTAAMESQIVDAMSNTIATAKLLGIAPQELFALSAGLIAAGLSAEEAGTAIRRAFENMLQNVEILERASGKTQAALRSMIGTDPVGFFIKLVDGINAIEDPAERALAALTILEVRGMRAMTATGEQLRRALDLANSEFANGTALQNEYARALQSTNNQMKLAKNALNEIALTIGDALLPPLNEIIQIAAATFQILADRLKQTEPRVRIIIAAVVALLPAFFILLTTLGSVTFAVGIFISGLTTMVSTLFTLAIGLQSVIVMLGLFSAGIVLGAALLRDHFVRALQRVLDILDEVSVQVRGWGEGLMRTLALGILDGAKHIIRAAITVANAIASFFRAKSPPEKGPLSQIVQWGKALIDTYLSAFKLADFDILREVGNLVRDIFETFSVEGLIGEIDIIPGLLQFREGLARVIQIFNETGQIAEDVLASITSSLGEAGDEVVKLIRLSLEYNAIQDRLNQIQRRRADIDRNLKREVTQIALRKDLTAAERLILIQQARQRSRMQKEGLAAEEDRLKLEEEAKRAELDRHKAYVDALRDTMNLQREQLELLRKLAEASEKALKEPKGEEPLGFSFDIDEAEVVRATNLFEGLDLTIQDVLKGISEARKAVEAFWRGITGQRQRPVGHFDPSLGDQGEIVGDLTQAERDAFKFGSDIRNNFMKIIEQVNGVRDAFVELGNGVAKFFSGEGMGDLESGPLPETLKKILSILLSTLLVLQGGGISTGLGKILGVVSTALGKAAWIAVLSGIIEAIIENREAVLKTLNDIFGAATKEVTGEKTLLQFLENSLTVAASLFETLGDVSKLVTTALITGPGSEKTSNVFDELRTSAEKFINFVQEHTTETGLIFALLFGRKALTLGAAIGVGIAGGLLGIGAQGGVATQAGVIAGIIIRTVIGGIAGAIAGIATFISGVGLTTLLGVVGGGLLLGGVIILILDKIFYGGRGQKALTEWLDEAMGKTDEKIEEFFDRLGTSIGNAIARFMARVNAFWRGLTSDEENPFWPGLRISDQEFIPSDRLWHEFERGRATRRDIGEIAEILSLGWLGLPTAQEMIESFLTWGDSVLDALARAIPQITRNIDAFFAGMQLDQEAGDKRLEQILSAAGDDLSREQILDSFQRGRGILPGLGNILDLGWLGLPTVEEMAKSIADWGEGAINALQDVRRNIDAFMLGVFSKSPNPFTEGTSLWVSFNRGREVSISVWDILDLGWLGLPTVEEMGKALEMWFDSAIQNMSNQAHRWDAFVGGLLGFDPPSFINVAEWLDREGILSAFSEGRSLRTRVGDFLDLGWLGLPTVEEMAGAVGSWIQKGVIEPFRNIGRFAEGVFFEGTVSERFAEIIRNGTVAEAESFFSGFMLKQDLMNMGRNIVESIVSGIDKTINSDEMFSTKILNWIIEKLGQVFGTEAATVGGAGTASAFAHLSGVQIIFSLFNGLIQNAGKILEAGREVGKAFIKGLFEILAREFRAAAEGGGFLGSILRPFLNELADFFASLAVGIKLDLSPITGPTPTPNTPGFDIDAISHAANILPPDKGFVLPSGLFGAGGDTVGGPSFTVVINSPVVDSDERLKALVRAINQEMGKNASKIRRLGAIA